MQIIYLHPHELKPYANNPRNNEDAVAAVAASIRQFGFKVPVLIDKDRVIVAGDTRRKAALLERLDKIPCIVCDDLNPEQIKALRLADNKVAEIAEWDYARLKQELAALDNCIDMEPFGFLALGDAAIQIEDASLDAFFAEASTTETEKKPKTVTCPHCGGIIEL